MGLTKVENLITPYLAALDMAFIFSLEPVVKNIGAFPIGER
jgi:hypothetical protein